MKYLLVVFAALFRWRIDRDLDVAVQQDARDHFRSVLAELRRHGLSHVDRARGVRSTIVRSHIAPTAIRLWKQS
jgi:hypothetical protein